MSDSEKTNDDLAHADVGLVCALPIELGTFLDRCEKVRKYSGGKFVFRGGRYDDIRIAIVECGTGFARARAATQSLIDAHSPDWILSSGFSGGLLPEMKPGQIVIANSIVDTHEHELNIDVHVAEDTARGLYVGRFVTADKIVRMVDEKMALAEQHAAIAVDLESLAVAQVCQETQTRFMAVRVISDDLSADLPPEVLSVIGNSGTVRLGAAIGSLWKRPSSAKDLWNLREAAMTAAERLADFLDGVVRQIYNAGQDKAES